MLDDHTQRSYTWVNVDVCLDHPGILHSTNHIDVHVACYSEFRVPNLDNRHLCTANTQLRFHSRQMDDRYYRCSHHGAVVIYSYPTDLHPCTLIVNFLLYTSIYSHPLILATSTFMKPRHTY